MKLGTEIKGAIYFASSLMNTELICYEWLRTEFEMKNFVLARFNQSARMLFHREPYGDPKAATQCARPFEL